MTTAIILVASLLICIIVVSYVILHLSEEEPMHNQGDYKVREKKACPSSLHDINI